MSNLWVFFDSARVNDLSEVRFEMARARTSGLESPASWPSSWSENESSSSASLSSRTTKAFQLNVSTSFAISRLEARMKRHRRLDVECSSSNELLNKGPAELSCKTSAKRRPTRQGKNKANTAAPPGGTFR